jgi:hypothetical protein
MSSLKAHHVLRGFAAVIKLTYRPMRIDTPRGASASFRLTSDTAR